LKETLQRAKRWATIFGLGVLLGAVLVGTPGAIIHQTTVKQYEEKMELFSSMTAKSIETASQMREQNEQLRKRTVERKNADGSTEKITELDSASSESDQTLVTKLQTLESQIQVIKSEHAAEITELKLTQPSTTLTIGVNSSLDYYATGTFRVWNNFSFQLYGDTRQTYGVGLGFAF